MGSEIPIVSIFGHCAYVVTFPYILLIPQYIYIYIYILLRVYLLTCPSYISIYTFWGIIYDVFNKTFNTIQHYIYILHNNTNYVLEVC